MSYNHKDTPEMEKLRGWLANRLSMDEMSSAFLVLWEKLKKFHMVNDALDPEYSSGKEKLLGDARELKELIEIGRKTSSPGSTTTSRLLEGGWGGHQPVGDLSHVFELPPDHPAKQRCLAFSLYVAKLADEDSKVKQFRQEVLDGELISSVKVAQAFISSPATAYFSSYWFKENDVPIVGHSAQVLEQRRLYAEGPRRLQGTLKVEWDDGTLQTSFDGTALPEDSSWWWGAVGSEVVSVMEGSMLSDLLKLKDHLSQRFPWHPLLWDELEMLMLVLMGKVPLVDPVRVSLPMGFKPQYDTVSITVCPWVPVEDVKSVYEQVRRLLNPTPIPSPRRLALYRFVMQHPKVRVFSEWEMPDVPSWRSLMCSWNEQHPEGDMWHYKDVDKDRNPDPRNFRRDFSKAFDQIVNFYRHIDDGSRLIEAINKFLHDPTG